MTPEQRAVITKFLHLYDAAQAVLLSQQPTEWNEQFTPVSKIALGGLEYVVHSIDADDMAELFGVDAALNTPAGCLHERGR